MRKRDIRTFLESNRNRVKIGMAILLIYIGFAYGETFSSFASGGYFIRNGSYSVNEGYGIGFTVSLVVLGLYLIVTDIIQRIKA